MPEHFSPLKLDVNLACAESFMRSKHFCCSKVFARSQCTYPHLQRQGIVDLKIDPFLDCSSHSTSAERIVNFWGLNASFQCDFRRYDTFWRSFCAQNRSSRVRVPTVPILSAAFNPYSVSPVENRLTYIMHAKW